MASANTETTSAVILSPDGSVSNVPTVLISDADAKLLDEYKKFLLRHGLREALYCNTCWSGERHDGCEAHVTSDGILIRCRCRVRIYQGARY